MIPKLIEKGQITGESYLKGLKQIVERDQILINFYLQHGLIKWAQFVAGRKEMAENELKDSE
jgi:hypothetical protein